MPAAPTVFISYSHDGEAHELRVLDLANRLRDDGIDAEIDQYETNPPEGWPCWCERKIKEADFVVLVCTNTYLRCFDADDPGEGLGVLWEARVIRQLIYDDSARTNKYVPVLLKGGSADHIPSLIKGATRWEAETPGGYEGLYGQLSNQPKVTKPALGTIKPRESRSGPAAAAQAMAVPALPLRPAAGSAPHARAGEVFVGRTEQLGVLAACLLPADAARRRPVAVTGMGGVGKSYLVDRFFIDNRAAFAGGYHRLALLADKPGSAGELLALLADRLQLPAAADEGAIAAALVSPLALVHVENADTPEAAATAGDLAARLPGCALVFSARMGTLAACMGWGKAALSAFDEADALAQFHAELGAAAPPDEGLRPVIAALGGLPLALHLAAGHLETGETPAGFLKLLRRKGLSLAPINPADPSFRERSHNRLEAVFALSLAALGRAAAAGGRPAALWTAAYHALGHGPAAGFGESLGAAIAGLGEDDFADLARAACALSLLDRVPRGGDTAWRLHPLLAELGRRQTAQEDAVARMTGWFCARLPMPEAGEAWRWNEVHAETAALLEWLPLVPPADRRRVERAGTRMAVTTGPFHAWRQFCEMALEAEAGDEQRSNLCWTLGRITLISGDLDGAMRYAKQKHDLDQRRGSMHEVAIASGLLTDILELRGEFDEALRIIQEEQLPAFEGLGNVREWAFTKGRIAGILYERALRQLDDEKYALLEQALEIRQKEELPIYEWIGDKRQRTLTMNFIADILFKLGNQAEAVLILHEDVLPKFAELGDDRALLLGRANLSQMLLVRNNEGDRQEAERLLRLALADARRLRIPEARQIEAILQHHGLRCD